MPRRVEVKSILNKTKRRDPWFLDDYTINPYSACSFNCLFCYIRGSKYGTNLETSLSIKTNAIEVLDKQLALRSKKKQFGFIVVSSATDPYLPIESTERITRGILEIILKHRFPVHIITRSNMILRDVDLLMEISERALLPEDLKALKTGTLISFSFSTLRDEVAAIFEPGATPPSSRLHTSETIKKIGFKTGISLMPLLPYISDTTDELEHSFSSFKKINVDYVMPAGITLFGQGKADSKTLVLHAVQKHYPHLHERYLKLFSQHNSLPLYYQNAFSKKMAELSQKYNIPDKIYV